MTQKPTIFISYATPDRERVLEIYNFLVNSGYDNIWIDYKKILPGQNWDFEIKRNLQKADIVIVIMSKNSVQRRGYVQKELAIVLKNLEEKLVDDIYIIPIKLDTNVQAPELLFDLQWLDINLENSYEQLKASLDLQTEKLGLELPIHEFDYNKVKFTKSIVSEKWEGLPGYEVEYAVPNFYSDECKNINEITKIIEARLINTLHYHRRMKFEQFPKAYTWAQDKFRRTSTFDASFGNVYQNNNIISFHYTIHWYGAGAAHPNYHFETYNFFLEPLIEIDSLKNLFEVDSNVFDDFVSIVRKKLTIDIIERRGEIVDESVTQLDESDIEWLNSGTKDWKELSHFTFSDEGVTIYFAPYSISGYAMGAFTVTIPYDNLPGKLDRSLMDALSIPRRYYED